MHTRLILLAFNGSDGTPAPLGVANAGDAIEVAPGAYTESITLGGVHIEVPENVR